MCALKIVILNLMVTIAYCAIGTDIETNDIDDGPTANDIKNQLKVTLAKVKNPAYLLSLFTRPEYLDSSQFRNASADGEAPSEAPQETPDLRNSTSPDAEEEGETALKYFIRGPLFREDFDSRAKDAVSREPYRIHINVYSAQDSLDQPSAFELPERFEDPSVINSFDTLNDTQPAEVGDKATKEKPDFATNLTFSVVSTDKLNSTARTEEKDVKPSIETLLFPYDPYSGIDTLEGEVDAFGFPRSEGGLSDHIQ